MREQVKENDGKVRTCGIELRTRREVKENEEKIRTGKKNKKKVITGKME